MGLIKAFFSLSFLTALSRVSGFVKVAALAAFYGGSFEADVFMAVMLLPDLLYKFLSEGLVSCAAVPMFVEKRENKEQLEQVFYTLFWLLLLFGLVVAALFTGFSSLICGSFFPGFQAEALPRISYLWSVLTLYLVLILPTAVLGSFLNSFLSFAMPAMGPLIVNGFIIAGIFYAAGGPIEIIIYATVLGAFFQLLWHLYLIKRSQNLALSFKRSLTFNRAVAKEFVAAVLPVMLWVSSLAMIPVYERYLLSTQTTGSLAALNYAEKLFNLPLGIISISLASVILPSLSLIDAQKRKAFLGRALGYTALMVLPVLLVIWLFSDSIVELVYKRGQFSSDDGALASSLFKSYSLALLPVSLNLVLNRGFFAEKKYLFPVGAGLLASATIFIIGFNFIGKFGVAGVGYAATIAYSIQTIALFLRIFL
jgi:putative peptidoglycan lipid II flippase